MKKFLLGVLSVALFAGAKAQDFDKVKSAVMLTMLPNAGEQQFNTAKAELDKLVANPKAANKAETYMYQVELYGTVAGNENLKAKYPNAAGMAYQALQKYLQLDPTEAKLKDDNYMGISGIYASYFNEGVEFFNKKNWDSAFVRLKMASEVSDLFIAKKWSPSAFDTAAYLYAGASAQNAKKDADAIKFYTAIVDRKIAGPDYESVYDYVAKYYYNNKDEANFKKYLAAARAAYPTNTVWNDLEFANTTDNITPEDMLKKFNEAEAVNTITASSYLDYADFFANNKKIKALDATQKLPYTEKAAYAFWKSYEKDSSNSLVAYNAGVTYYSLFADAYDYVQSIKGITPEIKAKRDAAYKVSDAAADKAIRPLEVAFGSLAAKTTRSSQEKTVLGKVTDLLFNIYDYKRNRSKVLNPKDYDRFDVKAKYYDNLHGKF